MTGHAFQVFVDDDQLRESLTAIRSALTGAGRFVFETRNPLAREWESWTPDNAVEVVHNGPCRANGTPGGDPRCRRPCPLSPLHSQVQAGNRPQISRSTLRFLGAELLSSFLSGAGLAIEEQFGDWDLQELTDTSPEIIIVAR